MRSSRKILLVLAGAAALHACAYPEFQFEDEDDGKGAGGAGPTSTSSIGGGGTSAGGGPPACNLLDPTDPACGAGTKCGVSDEASGAVGCVEAGSRPVWSRCDADPECAPGLFCDTSTHVCRPFCQTANDCPSTVAKCIAAPSSTGGDIPGVKICTAHCHPLSGNPCDNSSGPTTCFFDTGLVETDCGATANTNVGSACTSVLDCKRGALCVSSQSQALCRQVCTPVGDQIGCNFDQICADTSPELQYNGTTYGVCVPIF